MAELKRKILELLKENLEFRYAVAGLIGIEEILRKLDGHGEELARLREDIPSPWPLSKILFSRRRRRII